MDSTKDPKDPLLLSKNEAAKVLGVSVRTIENLLRRCDLPSVPIGRRRMIPVNALTVFVRRRTTHAGRELAGVQ
jgi:excisionase family DNA binding protein